MPPALNVWIDTDFGSDADDAVAILLALASPELNVQGITVAGRQSFVRALMVRAYVDAAGRPDIPVFPGWDAPTVPPNELNANTAAAPGLLPAPGTLLQQWTAYQFNWFGNNGWYNANHRPDEGVGVWNDPPDSTAAGAALAAAYGNGPGPSFIAIGPMTNLYQAIAHSGAGTPLPPLVANIPAVYAQGLHFHPTAFNNDWISSAVDYNLASDPVAAIAVMNLLAPLASSLPSPAPALPSMNFVTADLTLQTWLTQDQLRALADEGRTFPVLGMLSQMIGAWSIKQAQLFNYRFSELDNVGFLHDPLTVAASFGATDPATGEPFVQLQAVNVELVLDTVRHVRAISHPAAAPKVTRTLNCSAPLAANVPSGNPAFSTWVVNRLLHPPVPWPTSAPPPVPPAWPAGFSRRTCNGRACFVTTSVKED